jgi:hypothetical protein
VAELDSNPNRIKHLEFIEATINRLREISFLLKGWTVTLVAALFALAAKDAQQRFAIISLLPALSFWGLDGYYLNQERLFRALFKHAASAESTVPTYSMDPSPYGREVGGWFRTCFTMPLLAFYLPIFLAISVAIFTTSPTGAVK